MAGLAAASALPPAAALLLAGALALALALVAAAVAADDEALDDELPLLLLLPQPVMATAPILATAHNKPSLLVMIDLLCCPQTIRLSVEGQATLDGRGERRAYRQQRRNRVPSWCRSGPSRADQAGTDDDDLQGKLPRSAAAKRDHHLIGVSEQQVHRQQVKLRRPMLADVGEADDRLAVVDLALAAALGVLGSRGVCHE